MVSRYIGHMVFLAPIMVFIGSLQRILPLGLLGYMHRSNLGFCFYFLFLNRDTPDFSIKNESRTEFMSNYLEGD